MSLILSVRNLQKYYSDQPLLEDVSFEIRTGDRVSLIGPNGAGKSTILKLLRGQLEPDRGEIEIAKNAKLGFLEQETTFSGEQTVWQVAEQALEGIRQLEKQANQLSRRIADSDDPAEREWMANRLESLHFEIEQRGGFQLEYKIERVLQGLGFQSSDFDRRSAQLSGGETNRLSLAKLLLEEPDLMLLDEPSNHLDIEATEWLEEFLCQSRCAFLLVSHDRYFLDRVVTRTLELVHGAVDDFPGNFSKYHELKNQRLLVQQRTFEKQQAEIAKMEDFIRRNHYGQKASQAEDRRKKLSRIEQVSRPRSIELPPMRFPKPSRTGDIVLRAEGLSKRYGERTLFDRLNFQIERGERWGILGPNGCGKSTLLKCLVGETNADIGKVVLGTGVQLGYFDQKLESVNGNLQAYDAIRPRHKELIDRERRDLLAQFGITGDLALQTVATMSGGERNRVALAKLSSEEANFLVLDEPTNHLDLWSREALERALIDFSGTLLIVSHDRYFLNRICTNLLVFETNRFVLFEGTYENYREMARHSTAEGRKSEAEEWVSDHANHPKNRKGNSTQVSELGKKKRKFPYRKTADIEREIAVRENEIESIHTELANPETLRDGKKVIELKKRLKENQELLPGLYEHWQEALDLNG